ncbi:MULTISPECIES: NAD(P)/FAD-dependent oxidoreductase [Thalassolituus]|jgi:predicted Rossmann fold flavoprotein|uniref:Pyridine nucleotide-disulfide oxidoreductase n=1 Tax=Thalassolituus oleivorans MIL-1 TaxID=1298593 RepID=M5DTS4_9GAMM|nr:NAD(P)/FAD-dependent oxidoreductase [Thalassolituus oleivorans]AHK15387.1 membrane protein [Thalassolituus oleivorans R6-15]MBQ0726179.1 NAD(P)/FAD-dependent oxidoreductase [Thalassolituus oleivorans]MBQ0780727.1 NAD(P)/FAD-dependent oxidoreductase [Thalassolituus oleivorans]CCU72832.1 pyridine nucleotide-disulfide oxidoreductase [Thalassolituus oleivorans MIL-1]
MVLQVDVVIIGAGAAGLFCAANAAKKGRSVLVLDHANKAGKKILMSGGGRCNFTNYYIEPSRYLSRNPHFCKSALSRYTQWDFIGLVDAHGIPWHEKKDGQLFCNNKAVDILNMLLQECDTNGAEVRLNTKITSIEALENGGKARYQVSTEEDDIRCESVVIATGGPSIPTLGATGYGYDIAKQFGLKVYPPVAGLVPFVITDQTKSLVETLSGTALPVQVQCGEQSFSEDMLFTHRGLSGPAILQISSYWSPGSKLHIDLLPTMRAGEALRQQQHERPKLKLRTWLAEQTTQKFAEVWLSGLREAELTLAELDGQAMDVIASRLHDWEVKPSGTEGYRTAEVALGGVDTDELSSKTMESKSHPGLFFIGEVVDVTGHLGGFNFQWAWASAWAAAEYV